jgi:hypothetical protein
MSDPAVWPVAVVKARTRARKLNGPEWKVKRAGDDDTLRTFKVRSDAIKYWTTKSKHEDIGDVWIIRDGLSGVKFKAVEFHPALVNTEGNSDIDKIYSEVLDIWRGKIWNDGICNRRAIEGTSSWSQHSPWPAPNPGSNAWDIGAKFDQLKIIAPWLVAKAKHNDLPIGRVIFNHQIWDPSQGWHAYVGSDPHTSHIHVEGTPERQGTPRASCP